MLLPKQLRSKTLSGFFKPQWTIADEVELEGASIDMTKLPSDTTLAGVAAEATRLCESAKVTN
jgi:hypothetical protein